MNLGTSSQKMDYVYLGVLFPRQPCFRLHQTQGNGQSGYMLNVLFQPTIFLGPHSVSIYMENSWKDISA
ncbi:unnamed protein product [Musa acuminata var. zebrina]